MASIDVDKYAAKVLADYEAAIEEEKRLTAKKAEEEAIAREKAWLEAEAKRKKEEEDLKKIADAKEAAKRNKLNVGMRNPIREYRGVIYGYFLDCSPEIKVMEADKSLAPVEAVYAKDKAGVYLRDEEGMRFLVKPAIHGINVGSSWLSERDLMKAIDERLDIEEA